MYIYQSYIRLRRGGREGVLRRIRGKKVQVGTRDTVYCAESYAQNHMPSLIELIKKLKCFCNPDSYR